MPGSVQDGGLQSMWWVRQRQQLDDDKNRREYTICRNVDGNVSCVTPDRSNEEEEVGLLSLLVTTMLWRYYLDLYVCPENNNKQRQCGNKYEYNYEYVYQEHKEEKHTEDYNLGGFRIVPHQCIIWWEILFLKMLCEKKPYFWGGSDSVVCETRGGISFDFFLQK